MQDFYLIVNWLVTVALLCLGCAALLKNRNFTLNKVFAVFTVTISIWIIASYISNDTKNSAHVSIVGNYLVFLFSYISGYLLAWFAVVLAADPKASKFLRKLSLPLLIVGATTCTPLVVAGVKRQGGVYAVEFGPLVGLYFLGLVLMLVMALIVLHKNIRYAKGGKRAHLVILYRSMAIALPILLVTEFILPAITGWFGLTDVGILAMAIPVVGLYYSVVKLRLFNLRLVVVRTLGYVVTLGVLSVFYGATSYYASTLIASKHYNLLGDGLNVVLIMAVAVTYAPLKKIFDRLSSRLFYQDAYDSQGLFDELNRLFVVNTNLEHLLRSSTKVIEENFKAEFCVLGTKATEHTPQRIIGSGERKFSQSEIDMVRKLTPRTKGKVIIVDELDVADDKLRQILEHNDIAVLGRLTTTVDLSAEGIGYLVLGPRKSGNPYNSGDKRVLEIIVNELVIAIENSLRFEEIRNFNETLKQRVDEATKQLRSTNVKLKSLDETKDDFISMASHQLRTPLTSVKGYLSLVLEGDAGAIKPSQRKLLTQAFTSSQRMVYLIADLLNVSRLKTGKFIIESHPVNLANVVQEEIEQLAETAESRSLTLKYSKPTNFPVLNLDETKVRQVIMNFIDNAIYYTQAGGNIEVKLADNPKSVELQVIDDGMGVPKAEQHHLFTKFYRAANARRARPDGTGLGLFMAQKVVVAQGGAIIFKSKEGKGSTFGFNFPKK